MFPAGIRLDNKKTALSLKMKKAISLKRDDLSLKIINRIYLMI